MTSPPTAATLAPADSFLCLAVAASSFVTDQLPSTETTNSASDAIKCAAAKRLCTDDEFLRVSMGVLVNHSSVAPYRADLSPRRSMVESAPRLSVMDYMSQVQAWLDGRGFLSIKAK